MDQAGSVTQLHLRPISMVAGGAALARDESGRVVFVNDALPGEVVVARLLEERSDYARADAIEILEPSPERVTPPCVARAAGCGGCSWQHVSGDGQLRLKAEIVTDALRRIARLVEAPVPSVAPLAGRALRTTARLSVSASGRAGHQPRRGGLAVPTDACLAAHPDLADLVVNGRYPGAESVLLRVGVASGERLVRVDPAGAAPAAEVPDGVTVTSKGPGRRTSSAFVHEEVGGRRFRIGAESFFQPGPVAADALVGATIEAVGDALSGGGHLLDAYAGVGLFASVLGAVTGARATAVETGRAAVADAKVNLADLDARVVAAEVGRWRPRRAEDHADVVVADPPRSGLGRPGVATVDACGASRLVLVSCDPASLARDAALLAGEGFRLTSIALVDAFPDTFHVETVCRFDR